MNFIKEKVNSCRGEIRNLWRVKDLRQKNKKKVYEALVTFKLCYPPNPVTLPGDYCATDAAEGSELWGSVYNKY